MNTINQNKPKVKTNIDEVNRRIKIMTYALIVNGVYPHTQKLEAWEQLKVLTQHT